MRTLKSILVVTLLIFSACSSVYTENRAKRERDEARARLKQQQEYLEKNGGQYQTGVTIIRDNRYPYYNNRRYRYRDNSYDYRPHERSSYYQRQERSRERYQQNKQDTSRKQPRVHRPY